ncbi:hypothetical protein SLS57_008682 [Botryosphaeria dothidea]
MASDIFALVCFAVFISISSREIGSKVIAIWWPTATFVALALDHVVANMFFVPLGIWCGAPFGAGYYIWKSMIPTALGNITGGGLFVGTAYWYLYLTGEVGVNVRFDIGSLSTAEEVGGPMRSGRKAQHGVHGQALNGVDLEIQRGMIGSAQLPHSGSPLKSGISAELGDDTPFTKSHAERTASKESKSDEKV